MSYATLTANLETYLTAAGATMSNPSAVTVVVGEPTTVDRPLIAYWFIGIKPWDSNTLAKTQEQWGFHIRAYLPTGQRGTPPRGQVEAWIATLTSAIRAQLYSHVNAGGAATGLGMELSDASASELDVKDVHCRTVDMDWWPQMSEVASITRG